MRTLGKSRSSAVKLKNMIPIQQREDQISPKGEGGGKRSRKECHLVVLFNEEWT